MREGPAGVEYFVPGPGLLPLAEYRESGGQLTLTREYIYAGPRLIASEAPASAVTFTDDPIVPQQTVAKAVHLTELRAAVNDVRRRYGLAPVTWVVDPTVTAQVTVIKTEHVEELRAALNAVLPRVYTDPTLTKQVTAVKAAHVTELREHVRLLLAQAVGPHYYHLDALGSVRAVTDATGAAVRRHDYEPFGEEINPPAGSDARRFTGKEREVKRGSIISAQGSIRARWGGSPPPIRRR